MPIYKDQHSNIHVLDDQAFEPLLPPGCIQITAEEAAAIQKPTAAIAASVKWLEIKAERDRRTETGGYKVGASWFHSDQKSRSQQLGLARRADRIEAAAGNLDAAMQDSEGNPIAWKTMNGSFVPMTARLAQQIAAAAESADLANFKAADAHKAAMEASADPSAYDFSAGWPAVFEA